METLHEIDIEHRAQARALGIHDYRMVPGLNDSPPFIGALAGLVRRRVAQAYPAIVPYSAEILPNVSKNV